MIKIVGYTFQMQLFLFLSSVVNAKAYANTELECDICAPSPKVLTFTMVSSSTEFFNCEQIFKALQDDYTCG